MINRDGFPPPSDIKRNELIHKIRIQTLLSHNLKRAYLGAIPQTISHQLELHSTGLMADFLKLNKRLGLYEPVAGRMLERSSDKFYSWNSCRSPWRLAVYYACAQSPHPLTPELGA